MQSRISIIQNGKGKVSRAFLRTNEELNFTVGLDDNTKTLPAPISDSSMKGLDPCLEAVARTGWLENSCGDRLQHLLWRSQVGRPDGKINKCWPAPLCCSLSVGLLGSIASSEDTTAKRT
jgi:hypothetical protein